MKLRSKETNKRTLIKAVTYRLYQSFVTTPIITFVLTGNTLLAFKFSILEFVVKFPAYYLFEKLWVLVPHGYKTR